MTVNANGGGGLRGSGGIVGHNEGTVSYCINGGTVYNGYRRAGGIVGYNYGPAATIDHCYNVGNVSSAGDGYAGAIVATNGENTSTAGIVSSCYYLTGSAMSAAGLDYGSSNIKPFNVNGKILDNSGAATATDLIDAIDPSGTILIDPAVGVYPVFSWQSSYEWDAVNVAITAATPGAFTVSVNGSAITDSAVRLVSGTTVELSASAPTSGYLFTGFVASAGGIASNIGGTGKTAPYTKTYTVTSDVELWANYVSTAEQALDITTRTGLHGKSSVISTETWQDLLDLSDINNDGYGYMYTHGSDGWKMVVATQYVTIANLFSGLITPDDTDSIMVAASDGSPSVVPTWKTITDPLYFFPNATTSTVGGDGTSKIMVPSALALSWASSAVDLSDSSLDTAAKALTAGAAKSYNSTSLRMVYGSTEADYSNITSMSTIQGNRLWSGVNQISIAKTPAPYTGTVVAAPIVDAANGNKTPYASYDAAFSNADQVVSISASGLVPYTNGNGDTGDFVGIGIPVPDGVAYTDIWIGTNNTVFANAGKTMADFTKDSVNYVMLEWDYKKLDSITNEQVSYIQFSLDGGTTIYEIGVDTSGITENAVNFCGVGLSMDMLKAYSTTATYTMNGTPYTVTGIKVSDILKYYAPEVKPAALMFESTKATVYNCDYIGTGTAGTPQYSGYDWSESMLIWSQLDGTTEKITSGLKSAVNGGTGKMWWSGVKTVSVVTEAALTIRNSDGLFADRFVSFAQLKEHPTTVSDWTKITGAGTTSYAAITGIMIEDLLSMDTSYGAYGSEVSFLRCFWNFKNVLSQYL